MASEGLNILIVVAQSITPTLWEFVLQMFANMMANWPLAQSTLNAFVRHPGMVGIVNGWLVGGWQKKVK